MEESPRFLNALDGLHISFLDSESTAKHLPALFLHAVIHNRGVSFYCTSSDHSKVFICPPHAEGIRRGCFSSAQCLLIDPILPFKENICNLPDRTLRVSQWETKQICCRAAVAFGNRVWGNETIMRFLKTGVFHHWVPVGKAVHYEVRFAAALLYVCLLFPTHLPIAYQD